MLHVINRSLSTESLKYHSTLIEESDALLFIDEGLSNYAKLQLSHHQATFAISSQVLGIDIPVVGYDKFVELSAEHKQTLFWK